MTTALAGNQQEQCRQWIKGISFIDGVAGFTQVCYLKLIGR
jgi:hypothetical protein